MSTVKYQSYLFSWNKRAQFVIAYCFDNLHTNNSFIIRSEYNISEIPPPSSSRFSDWDMSEYQIWDDSITNNKIQGKRVVIASYRSNDLEINTLICWYIDWKEIVITCLLCTTWLQVVISSALTMRRAIMSARLPASIDRIPMRRMQSTLTKTNE